MITYKKHISIKSLFEPIGENDVNAFLNHKNKVFCSSVRTGLLDVLDSMNFSADDYVFVPPICPQGLILPLKKRHIKYKFYHLINDFKVDISALESELKEDNCKAIFFIHYFGLFNSQIHDLKSICGKNDTLLFEDIVHGFLGKDQTGNELGIVGDVSFCSLSKFFPTPDGAVFIVNNEKLNVDFNPNNNINRSISVFFNVLSLCLNRFYIEIKNRFFRKLIKFISLVFYSFYYYLLCASSKNSSISAISQKILSNIDFDEFINKRKELFLKYNEYFKLYKDNFVPISPGYPIINPDVDFRIIKNKLNHIDVEALTYIRAWNYIPEDKCFDYERKLIHGHILLPLDINKMEEYNEQTLNVIKEILDETSLFVSKT